MKLSQVGMASTILLLAALLLMACGDDDGNNSGEQSSSDDATSEQIQEVREKYCTWNNRCLESGEETPIGECVSELEEFDRFDSITVECFEASYDYYDCLYQNVDCDDIPAMGGCTATEKNQVCED